VIETERLVLRRWLDRDREPYAAMSADPEVMDWLGGGIRTRAQSDAQIDRFLARHDALGYGFLAIERKADAAFLGFVGLDIADVAPAGPNGIEIGWRLARHAWGCGYATEAAHPVLEDALGRLGLADVLSFTARSNIRSQAVMRRIGLNPRPDLDFDHPRLAVDHPLRPHVVWSTRAAAESPRPLIAAGGSMG
jgi:ribosomal-protein-alanine N-acetyltransferase